MQFPEGTELSARQSVSTEDGPEPDYTVWEETPAPRDDAAKTRADHTDVFGIDAMLEPAAHYPGNGDDAREESLVVNVEMVTVHHVEGVTFDTDTFPVRRHRFEKCDLPF